MWDDVINFLTKFPSDIDFNRLGKAKKRMFFGNFREIMFVEYENGFELCFTPKQVRVCFSRGRKNEAYDLLSHVRRLLEEHYAVLR